MQYITLFTETFTDMFANSFSVLVLAVLGIMILTLVVAMFNKNFHHYLINKGVIDESETPKQFLTTIIGLILIVKLVQAFVVQPFIVDGGSMLPNLHHRDALIVDKISYLLSTPTRGDVVIFKLEEDEAGISYRGRYLIKRIIGLPGERVRVNGNDTIIYNSSYPDGLILNQDFVEHTGGSEYVDITLKEDEYFVMGDNRAQSYDSRDWGALHQEHIRGRALLRIYPFGDAGIFPAHVDLSN